MEGNIFTPKIHDIIIPGCFISDNKEEESDDKQVFGKSYFALKEGLKIIRKPRESNKNEATLRLYELA